MKLTLGDIKANISKVLSMPSTDSRVLSYINEAQERLVYKGKWPGTYLRYALTSSSGTITWPRQLETIEAFAVADLPGIVRNEWYEFLETGPGILDSDDGDSLTLVDRESACCFSDIAGTDKYLKAYSGNDIDEFKTMIFQGYDASGNWIRSSDVRKGTYSRTGTEVTATITAHGLSTGDSVVIDFTSGGATDGTYSVTVVDANSFKVTDSASGSITGNVTMTNNNVTIDGEKVTLGTVAAPVITTNIFSILSAVIRDETKYNVEVKEYTSASERLIAEYEPTETRPNYRRSLIAGLTENSTKTITIVGKMRFIPASADNDWLYINYEAAIKLMVMAIRKEETNNIQEATAYEGQAVQLLNDQLMHYLGDGAAVIPRFVNTETYGGGSVLNYQ